jgi:protein-L-isoaspartate(D-aspartate) O-methyltransferase
MRRTTPEVLPLIAVRGQVYFPRMSFPLWVSRDKSVRALGEARARGGSVLVVTQRRAGVDDPRPGDLYEWGVAAEVVKVDDLPDGALSVMLKSQARVRVREYLQAQPFYRVRVEFLAEEEDRSAEAQPLIRRVAAEFQQIAAVNKLVPPDALSEAMKAEEAGYLADTLAPYLTLPVVTQQELLETLAPRQRLEQLASFLNDPELLRAGLVEMLSGRRSISTAACRRAFLRVPRHRFVPSVPVAAAYADIAISTHTRGDPGHEVGISSISAPGIVAFNVGQLRLRPGLRVLEIGAGTSYNAAILAEIIRAENVTSIDLDPEIVAEARANSDATGYHRVFVDVADGWDGYRERAPYDRILLTVGVDDVAPAWVEQLREGGLLVGWFSFRNIQLSIAFRKRNGCLVSESISGPLWSLDMRGKQPRRLTRCLGDRLTVIHDTLNEADLALLDEILDRPAEPFLVPELANLGPAGADFYAFLALAHRLAMQVSDPRLKAQGIEGNAYAIADLERRQLVVPTACFGGPEIGEEFRRLAREWLALGRPGVDRLVLAAYPRNASRHVASLHDDRAQRGRGRWMGLVEKEHTWFRWRYKRPARSAGRQGAGGPSAD